MKTKSILLIVFTFLLFIAGACKEENDITKMSLSSSSLNAPFSETSLTLEVNSQDNWEVSSDANWCVPDKLKGTGKATLRITLTANETSQPRVANLTITDATTTLKVEVTQGSENDNYKLPVIFHVLYANANDPKQNPKGNELAEIIRICNQRVSNRFNDGDQEKNSTDLNIEFVMATTDPNGKTLAEPGVNRIKWGTPVIDCDKFMDDSNKEAIPLVWDLNKYINIFLYTFETPNVMGISFIPYASSKHPLGGLHNEDRYFNNPKMTYPHCISINNEYIDVIPELGWAIPTDITCTLTHELGHYLGLFHAFGVDNEEEKTSWRDDTDYCEDTPNYDRAGYEKWLSDYDSNTPEDQRSFHEMAKRTSITGKQFTSRNTMDYVWTWGNEFTSDQRNRIRHVLHYSPLTPGPKYDQPSTRAAMDAPISPPRTIK